MKKYVKLLALTGLVASLLVGCNIKTKPASSSQAGDNSSISDNSSADAGSSAAGGSSSAGASSSSSQAPTLTGIEISSEPSKKTYLVGEQFDATGLVVKAVMSDGSKNDLSSSDYSLSGFDSDAPGQKTITVTYQGQTASFSVSVIGKDGISIASLPNKLRYKVGDEADYTGLVVEQKFTDGSKKTLDSSEYQVSGFDSTAAAEVELTVTAGDQTAKFSVKVYVTDWSADDKSFMTDETDGYLIFEIPYYLGFEVDLGGIENQEDPTKLDVGWVEAKTDYEATDDDLLAYALQIADITVEVDDGEGGKKEVQAWEEYDSASGEYSADIEYLGFAADSDLFEFIRYEDDDAEDASYYQVLAIGLAEDGSLMAVSTINYLPYASSFTGAGNLFYLEYLEGSSIKGNYYNYYLPVMEFIMQLDIEAPQSAAFMNYIAFPAIEYYEVSGSALTKPGTSGQVWYNGFAEPFFTGNVYSKYNETSFSIYYTNDGLAADKQYTQADVDALVASYGEGAQVETEQNGSKTVTFETPNGYTIEVNYAFLNGTQKAIRVSFKLVDYVLPFDAASQLAQFIEQFNDDDGTYVSRFKIAFNFARYGYNSLSINPFYVGADAMITRNEEEGYTRVILDLRYVQGTSAYKVADCYYFVNSFLSMVANSKLPVSDVYDVSSTRVDYLYGAKLNGTSCKPILNSETGNYEWSDANNNYVLSIDKDSGLPTLTTTPKGEGSPSVIAFTAEEYNSTTKAYTHVEGEGDGAVTTTLVLGQADYEIPTFEFWFRIFDDATNPTKCVRVHIKLVASSTYGVTATYDAYDVEEYTPA